MPLQLFVTMTSLGGGGLMFVNVSTKASLERYATTKLMTNPNIPITAAGTKIRILPSLGISPSRGTLMVSSLDDAGPGEVIKLTRGSSDLRAAGGGDFAMLVWIDGGTTLIFSSDSSSSPAAFVSLPSLLSARTNLVVRVWVGRFNDDFSTRDGTGVTKLVVMERKVRIRRYPSASLERDRDGDNIFK